MRISRAGRVAVAVLCAGLLPLVGPPPVSAATRPAARGLEDVRTRRAAALPPAALSLWAQDGRLRQQARPWHPSRMFEGATDPRSLATYARATRALVEHAWRTRIPDLRARAANLDPGATDVLRVALPAGDLDGDGLDDALVYEYALADGTVGLRALKGTDGRELWAPDLAGAYDVLPLAPGDLTGDGVADVLVVVLYAQLNALGDCAVLACAFAAQGTFRWEVSVLSGPTGAPAWTRAFPGTLTEGFAFGDAVAGFAVADAYTVENAIAFPLLSPDLGGDGLPDVVLNAFDVAALSGFGEAGIFVGGAFGQDLLLVRTRSEVVGAGGARVLAREHDYQAGFSYLYPVGDAVGSPAGDLAWETDQAVAGPFACAFALVVGECAQVARVVQDLEILDGSTGEAAWATRRTGRIVFFYPLERDLTGDGHHDLFFFDDLRREQGVLSGSDGRLAWTMPADRFFLGVLGPVDDEPGEDVLAVALDSADDGVTVHLQRLGGASGKLLFSTPHAFPTSADEAVLLVGFLVGDADADGVQDPVLDALFQDFRTGSVRSLAQVFSGKGGGVLFLREVAGEAFVAPAGGFGGSPGDLDADGRDDLLDLQPRFREEGFDLTLRGLSVAGGAPLWTRTDGFTGEFADVLLLGTGDQSGLGGDDLLYSRLEVHQVEPELVLRSRVDGLEGRDGSLTWGVGPAL